jgi:hypothetical protein
MHGAAVIPLNQVSNILPPDSDLVFGLLSMVFQQLAKSTPAKGLWRYEPRRYLISCVDSWAGMPMIRFAWLAMYSVFWMPLGATWTMWWYAGGTPFFSSSVGLSYITLPLGLVSSLEEAHSRILPALPAFSSARSSALQSFPRSSS